MIDSRTMTTLLELVGAIKLISAPKSEFESRLKKMKKVQDDSEIALKKATELHETGMKAFNEAELVKAEMVKQENVLANKQAQMKDKVKEMQDARVKMNEREALMNNRDIALTKNEREHQQRVREETARLEKQKAELNSLEEQLVQREKEVVVFENRLKELGVMFK